MKIYDYSKTKSCFVCGSIDGNFDRFIKNIIGSLNKTSSYQVETHPKEIERQERLKRKREEEENRNNNNGGDGLVDGVGVYHPRPVRLSTTFSKMLKMRGTGYNLTNSIVIVDGSNSFGERDLKYYHDKLEMLNKVLADNNTHILFVRGYDDPKYFEEELINLSNIKTVQDYSVIKFSKFNCLCIGGGISLDRGWKIEQEKRVGRKMYWENEALQYREKELEEIVKKHNIACVISTSCPSFAYPGMNVFKRSSWASKDKTLLKDMNSERMTMDKIYNMIVEHNKKPYIWVYSRFKSLNQNMINDILFQSLCSFQFFDFNGTAAIFFKLDFSKSLKENEYSTEKMARKLSSYRHIDEDRNPFDDVYEDGDAVAEEDLDVEDGGEAYEENIELDEPVDGENGIAVDEAQDNNDEFHWMPPRDWTFNYNAGGATITSDTVVTQGIIDRLNEQLLGTPVVANNAATTVATDNAHA